MVNEGPVLKTIQNALSPLARFARDQVIASVLLLVCSAVALVWANSRYGDLYITIFTTELGLYWGSLELDLSLRQWISEGLLALFFFFLGLEIKRELIAGDLRDWRHSMPVILAAVGGMICPALLYLLCNLNVAGNIRGWGIPMATDTAFAVGVLALLRGRVPPGLELFVTALAIIDDIGAMLVIALVYTGTLQFDSLVMALAITGALLLASRLGIRNSWLYALGGIVIWFALHESGVHATVAGILVAFTVPARSQVSATRFVNNAAHLLRKFDRLNRSRRRQSVLTDKERHNLVSEVADNAQRATTPLRRWENWFEKPVSLFVMPVFALANAGVVLMPNFITTMTNNSATIGIFVGLLLGKPLGIVLMTKLALAGGWGKLPENVNMRHIVGIGLMCGVGFTMSMLISTLAFRGQSDMLDLSKSAIMFSSLVAGTLGFCWLRFATKPAADSMEKVP